MSESELYTPGYKSLRAYQEAHSLVIETYKLTANFPKYELFGLVSQMRRAAISVTANIIEGWARNTPKEQSNFLHIARGSLTELGYYFELSGELGYFDAELIDGLQSRINQVGRLIHGLLRSKRA